MNENGLEKYAGYLPASVNLKALAELDRIATDFAALVKMNTGNPSAVVLRAAAMQNLREMLTDEMMAPIMALQGSKLGFLTDRDKVRDKRTGQWIAGNGYDVATVRDVTIWAWGNGARMTGNEVNIISGSGYLTKNFFDRGNNELLGRNNWWARAAVPSRIFSKDGKCVGANVSGEIWWKDAGGEHKQTLIRSIKGDDWASADSYIGKWERKAFLKIYECATNRQFDEGDVDDFAINTTAVPVEEKPVGMFGGERAPQMPRSDAGAAAAGSTRGQEVGVRPAASLASESEQSGDDDNMPDWLENALGPDCPVSSSKLREFCAREEIALTAATVNSAVNRYLDAAEAL